MESVLGTGVDGAVRHIGYAFNSEGLLEAITSYDDTGYVTLSYNNLINTSRGLNGGSGDTATTVRHKKC